MSRMNSRTRKRFYSMLVERDGERCRICYRRGNYHTLVIDHIDNNNDNNELWNLQLVCRGDNSRKNPRGPGKSKILSTVCVSVSEIDRPKIGTAEYAKNEKAEPLFRHWIYSETRKRGSIDLDEAIDNGAEAVGCSQETIKRYLKKMCCPLGPLQLGKDQDGRLVVVLRKTATE